MIDGSLWAIRNGIETHIWKDNWLPEQANFKFCSPITHLDGEATVSEPIDHDTRQLME